MGYSSGAQAAFSQRSRAAASCGRVQAMHPTHGAESSGRQPCRLDLTTQPSAWLRCLWITVGRTVLVGLACLTLATHHPGSLAAELSVVQVVPLTGAVAKDAEGVALGVRVGVDATNGRGGIKGAAVKLRVTDDRYQPQETERLLREGVAGGAVAAIMPVGSASMLHLLNSGALDDMQLPIVGVVPGAQVLRRPGSPWLFHLRASDDQQIEKIVEHAWTVGQRRIAILYGDIPFGHAGLAAATSALKVRSTKAVLEAPFGMANPEAALGGIGQKLRTAGADSVLVVGGATQSGKLVKLLRSEGVFAPIYALSYADVATVCDIAGVHAARGIGIAQIVPNHSSGALRIAAEFRRDWDRYAPQSATPSQHAFEGYIAWRVLADALTRGNEPLTRLGVRRALEQLSEFGVAGFRVGFSPQSREGARYVDIGVVSDNCRLKY